MNPEKEIILSLLGEVKKQLEQNQLSSATKLYIHPRFGEFAYSLNTKEANSADFEINTLFLDFSINQVGKTSKANVYLAGGQRETILEKLNVYIQDPTFIIENILPNLYRGLFDYPRTSSL